MSLSAPTVRRAVAGTFATGAISGAMLFGSAAIAVAERYCQDLWMGVFQASSVSCDSSGSAGVISVGPIQDFPLWKTSAVANKATR